MSHPETLRLLCDSATHPYGVGDLPSGVPAPSVLDCLDEQASRLRAHDDAHARHRA